MDRSDEIRALGSLTGDALAGTVRVVEDVHRAVSDRVHDALPPPAKPVSAIVRVSTAATYATVRAAHRWLPRGAAALASTRTPPDAPSMLESPLGRTTVATINGLWGPTVTDPVGLTTPMTLFRSGTAVDAATLPDARGHLVVFVHGLAESEVDWQRQPRGVATLREGYPEQLEVDAGTTSLTLRYSTGRPVGENGTALAHLLEALAGAWPTSVETITLVGHSMGGLVARSAAHHGQLAGHDWVHRLRLIVTLGTPHLGAPLERAVDLTERALGALPESAPLGRVLGARSPGVRDLHDGRIVVGDTAELDPPPLPHVTHCSVGSTLTQDPGHPVGALVGDGLVRLPSAAGRSRTRHLRFQVGAHLGGVSHLALLNEPAVYELLLTWVREHAVGPEPVRPA